MATQKNRKIDHSAAPSWDGFNYQGHVALYLALEMIQVMNLDKTELKKFHIELESSDDFALFEEGKCISIHQVKSTMDDHVTYNSVISSLDVIRDRLSKLRNVKAYFHHSVNVKNDTSFIDNKFEFTDNNYKNIFLAHYRKIGKHFIPVSEIEIQIKKRIGEIFYSEIEKINSKEQFSKIAFSILSMLFYSTVRKIRIESNTLAMLNPSKSVGERNKDAANKEKIPFKDIIETINKILGSFNMSDIEELNYLVYLFHTYHSYFLKSVFTKLVIESNYKKLAIIEQCGSHLSKLSASQRKLFLQLITPHKNPFEYSNVVERVKQGYFSDVELTNAYFFIIYNIEQEPIYSDFAIYYADNVNSKYLPTGMSFRYHTKLELQQSFDRSLLSNQDLLDSIFDYNFMIADSNEEYQITYTFPVNIFEMDYESDNNDILNAHKKTHTVQNSFNIISIIQAKELLNV